MNIYREIPRSGGSVINVAVPRTASNVYIRVHNRLKAYYVRSPGGVGGGSSPNRLIKGPFGVLLAVLGPIGLFWALLAGLDWSKWSF